MKERKVVLLSNKDLICVASCQLHDTKRAEHMINEFFGTTTTTSTYYLEAIDSSNPSASTHAL
jgi:hypothetical protein